MNKPRVRRNAILLLLVFSLLAGVALSLEVPYRGFHGVTYVSFDRGTDSFSMAETLQTSGVVRYSWQFVLARLLHPTAKLQAGEYRFDRPANVLDVFGRIAHGDIYFVEITIPEGSNMFDIARLAEASGVMTAQEFLKAAQDPALIRDLLQDLDPHAPSLEGYLFPSTYRVSHATTPAEFCRMMTAQFHKQWKRLPQTGDPGTVDIHQVVTLASLVEKESALPSERPLIAGVFTNRLRLKMRLECDPTTIYAALLDERYRGTIHKSDLKSQNPYNTYTTAGLPPGPIANPGAGALAAALHPAETKYLYFVAKPSGGAHQFSSTLAEHDKAVHEYRNATQAHKAAAKAGKKA